MYESRSQLLLYKFQMIKSAYRIFETTQFLTIIIIHICQHLHSFVFRFFPDNIAFRSNNSQQAVVSSVSFCPTLPFNIIISHCPQLFVATEEKWATAVDTSLWASIIRVCLFVYVSAPVCSMCVCGFLHVPEAVVLATRKFVVTTAASFGLGNVFIAHEFITIHA